jgi:photosystem II stability/assembly factor-like uncharacterized protein
MKKVLFFAGIFLYVNSSIAQVSSATFGTMEARQLGPGTMSGRITAIDGSASDGKTIYVGTAGGGIWKSTNAGASFKPIFDKYCQSIGAVAINQSNPNIIFAGTGESNMRNSVSIGNGLYRSTDAGDNWTKVGLDSTEHIAKIVIDPKNSDNIYVAAPGPLWSDSKHRGLYKSTDGGKTWDKILYINEKAGCADVAVDPQNPNIVFASTWEFRRLPYAFNSGGTGSGLYKSNDGGKIWKELTNGLPTKPFGRIAFALAPSSPQNMLAIVESESTGLYISSDGGESWKKQSATSNVEARPFYFSVIQVDPKDPKRVYRPAYVFSYSTDGGYSFADATNEGGWLHSDMHALWINPNNTNQIYLGTDGGVYFSLDKGVTWMFIQNLPVGQFYHVAIDNETPYNVMGGLQDNGSWIAPSSAPGGISNSNWKSLYGGDGFWVQPDPNDPNIVYAEAQGATVARIDKQTTKSVNIKPQQSTGEDKLRWNWNSPIVTGAANKKNLYIASQYLYRSTDHGRNWTRISPDLTTNDPKKQKQENSGGLSADNTSAENHCTIFTLAESPLDENIIWAGTDDGNLQFTVNGGKNWTNVSKNYVAAGIPAQTWVSSVEPSRFDKNTVYVTFDNHMYGDHKTYVARSTDMGKTWSIFSSKDFTGFAHKIKEDLVNKDLLFLGTEMGLFGTVDGGANWFRMKNNIPEYALVRDIQIDQKTNDLILATHGRGIMIVDDISPIRNLTKDIIDKDVYVFNNKPVNLTNGMFGGGGFPGTGGWVANNRPSIPPVQYYLKDRVSSGEVTVEIYDANNKLVQSIPGSKRKGINKVYWNLRMIPPKVATGGTKMDNSGFFAPMVLPGDYTMKLKVGDKEYTSLLKLVHDASRKDFTLEDRKLQYKTAMDIYALHEHLAKVVDDINGKQKMLKRGIDSTNDKKVKALLQEYNDKLESLRSELLATKQKSIFADEERLRERISEIYSAVTMQEAAPSNLQIKRVNALQQEVNKAQQTNDNLTKTYFAKAKEALDKTAAIKKELQPKLKKEDIKK